MAVKEEFDGIVVKGAREHNLQDVSVKIPRNKITVMTGLSGSGKSSLAFETVYAEGHRRYIESLSNYARQFLEQMKKPEVDSMTGLSPSIAIDQKSVSTNPRSTVGTVTEVYDFLRLLFAKIGVPECPTHHQPLASQTPNQIVEALMAWPENTKFLLLAPMAEKKKGEFLKEFQKWAQKGFLKARVDGVFMDLTAPKKLAKTKAHTIDLVVDQLMIKENLRDRLKTSVNTALSMAQGRLIIEKLNGERTLFSLKSVCPECGFSFPELEPRLFSFNHPKGACAECHGLGTLDVVEESEFGTSDEGTRQLKKISYRRRDGKPVSEDDESAEFESVLKPCTACQGARLSPEALSVKIDQANIAQLSNLALEDLKAWFDSRKFQSKQKILGEKILRPLLEKLDYLIRVGTGYLSVNRSVQTLSGGESQRLRLASQVGSSLVGVLYVLDEPSIGLHPRDHHKLLEIIGELRDRGNTVIMVEHDEDTICYADHIIDLGPRAGKLGGHLMVEGTLADIKKHPESLTGRYLRGELRIPIPVQRRSGHGRFIEVKEATGNNLQRVNLKVPLGTLTVVSGVSGSGKSTLIMDTLYKILARELNGAAVDPAPYKKINGLDYVDKVIDINQKPIGRTPRSTPATYVGLFPLIRDLFAQLPESKVRGYKPGQFSFNLKGGRCETCQGQGQIKLEMHFLSDVFVSCDVCEGRRYSREILAIRHRGKSIADVLSMSVEEALDFFQNHKLIYRKLETLHRVGLDYMTLGQSSTTLSGGEAQRIKLSRELSKRGTGESLYILDEPTTGLHFDDVRRLAELLHELVDQGNTVLVIEHNLEIIKIADHVIDLGPEAGRKGGEIVAEGTPEQVVKNARSVTGPFLKPLLTK
jgi:excinuclease ABC subunit A